MSAKVTPELIKTLRSRTGVGVGKCKEALEISGGDVEGAVEHLRKAGIASAVKKETRVTHEGRIEYLDTKDSLTLVEMNAETDFVVKNELFGAFQKEVLEEAAKSQVNELDDLLQQKQTKDPSKTIDDGRKQLISVLGENINITKVKNWKKKPDTSFGIYSHMNGKIVTVVELEGALNEEEFAKEIAMHVAAEAPDYLTPADIPENIKEKEAEIAKSQLPEGKPEKVLNMILEGKMKGFYDQVCLLNQKFIKDQALTVATLVENRAKEIGKTLKVASFIRWYVGGE